MIGKTLGRYRIKEKLGQGGMGTVYLAEDTTLGRAVALKVLETTEPSRLRRFEQEARAASSLNHPNIVTIYEVGEQDGVAFIAMEYIEGATLRESLERGPVDQRKLIRYAIGLVAGLAKAHRAGIVHRDLKPENIILTTDGQAKILDFGLAKLVAREPLRDAGSSLETVSRRGTAPGTVLGTVGYMAPEQVRGGPADHRADQFALGAILHEMASGERPFARTSAVETLNAILKDEPRPTLGDDVPDALRRVIRRCLAKDENDRFDATSDLLRDLEEIQEMTPSYESTHRGSFRAWLLAGVIVFLLALIALVIPPRVRDGTAPTGSASFNSLAVLPLDNLSGDPEQEYFVDGMTEALIADLAKVDDLRVISRTSVMQFKDERPAMKEVAQLLGVDVVVEGSVLKAGDRVRITAQLIDAGTDEHLWAESYERDLVDIIALQDEVSREIAREIQRTLIPSTTPWVGGIHAGAYDAYLRGRYSYNNRELDDAVAQFQESIRLQPNLARAYAGLALSHISARRLGAARDAVERALELSPGLAEAEMALAPLLYFEWRWREAEEQFRKAISLNPNDGFIRHAFSLFLSRLGRHDEAIGWQLEALEIDPLSPTIVAELGLRYLYAGRYEEAFASYERALQIAPLFGHGHLQLALGLLAVDRNEEAIEAARRADELGSFLVSADLIVAIASGRMGRLSEAERMLEQLKGRRNQGAGVIAALHYEVGDVENGWLWLQRAFDTMDPDLAGIAYSPAARALRQDPRYRDVLRRMGLDEVGLRLPP